MLRSALIASSILGLAACSSVKNDPLIEDETYEIKNEAYEIKDVVQTNAATYSCDSKPLDIYFHAEQAKIVWEKENYLLNHTISSTGVFYLGEGISFWINENKAKLKINDMQDTQCDLVRIDS